MSIAAKQCARLDNTEMRWHANDIIDTSYGILLIVFH